MPSPMPACFRQCAAGQPPPPAVQPTLTTSTYETPLGLAALTWSRTLLDLSLRFHLRLTSAADPPSPASADDNDDEALRFHVRPWLIWKRRGSKRFHLCRRRIDVSWDLSRALFPAASPEPSSNFYVSLSVDGETVLVAGDAAHKLAPSPPALLSRREHVVLAAAGSRTYKTTVRFGGRERGISIELSGGGAAKEATGMAVAVDGRRVLHVRRLRWKFRGSERIAVDGGGGRIHVSWDLHNWLFPSPPDAASGSGGGVFAFQFEAEARGEEERLGKEMGRRVVFDGGYFARSRIWSESSSGGGGEKGGRKGRLVKTSSFSSTSSAASTGSGSTVMDWDSPEEAELRRAVGFTLLVHVWKN